MLLGVNIDHVATLRNVRGSRYPSPLEAALVAQTAGADFITMHLREDRRHINENDAQAIKDNIYSRLNLEIALTDEMLEHALSICPSDVCLVPEKREELTTEGGLDVVSHYNRVDYFANQLSSAGIRVSLFIDPDERQIEAAAALNVPAVELHTGTYAQAQAHEINSQLSKIENLAYMASDLGMLVNAGHGLNYHNVIAIAKLAPLSELNIGHAIIAQSLLVGLPAAVKKMKQLIFQARMLLNI